jgi:hypothetical protein
MNNISHLNTGGSHRHGALEQYERSSSDLYTTPADAVLRLYKARPHLKAMTVWDSSAGLGHIVSAVVTAGGSCIGTELHDHPHPRVAGIQTGFDLLKTQHPFSNMAVVNPPYNQADKHIRHMLNLGCDVWAILRFNWITAKGRAHLMPHLEEILMVGRVGMLPPGVVDKGMSPSIDYAWFLFTPETKKHHSVVLERI